MKKYLSILLFVAVTSSESKAAVSAFLSWCTFDQPSNVPYIETYLNVVGPSVIFNQDEHNKFRARVEVQWIFRLGDKIIHFDKYDLLSPELDSANAPKPDFIDEQRVSLPAGVYDLELRIADKNSATNVFTTHQKVSLGYPNDKVSISDIEMLESYAAVTTPGKHSKNGYDLVPYILGYYPKEVSRITFYAEIYRTLPVLSDGYILLYYITNYDNNQVLNDFAGIKRQSPATVNAFLASLPIEDLPTGNYNLTIDLRDKENRLIASKQVMFQRINPIEKPMRTEEISLTDINNTFVSQIENPDTLVDYISCLTPIAGRNENQMAENQIAMRDVHSMQQYFYYFWKQRNAEDPENAWKLYKAEVTKVNAAYATINRKGYESERGRVYLQYGPPNTVTWDDQDPNAYPYEIWHYYKLGNQVNRKFVFYATDRSSNDYQLLHSDATGEIQNRSWELQLHSRSQQFGNDVDAEKSIDVYGSKTKENFANPK